MKKEYILILGLVIIIILLATCNSKPQPTKTITKTITRVDSIHTIDTVERIISVPMASVPEIRYNIDLSDTIVFYDTINTYYYGKKDSLLDYTIEIDGKCKPKDVRFKYDISQFAIRDYIYIRDSTHTNGEVKSFMSLGGTILGSKTSFGIAPMLIYSHKSGNNFGLGFDLINNNVHLQYSKTISFTKKR